MGARRPASERDGDKDCEITDDCFINHIMKLSAIIITKNEEATIARALKSVAFADERIVVDSESTDQTIEIAQAAGAQVFVRPWPGYGPQKNFGAQQAQGDWLLFIDADEEVTPELQIAISAVISQPQADFYWLRIVTVFLGHPLLHLYGHNPRLFKKSAGQWTEGRVHEQVQAHDGHMVKLGDKRSHIITQPLWHYSHTTVSSYLTKMRQYVQLDAQEMQRTGKHRHGFSARPTWWLAPYLALRQFVKLYFYRGGWRDGWAGFVWTTLSSYYEWEMALAWRRLIKKPL